MKKILTVFLMFPIMYLHSKIELLDRIAIIVDDGVVMESQINKSFDDLKRNYQSQGMEMPPKNIILDQIKEKLIIEELQLQMADRAGVKISDAELNSALMRLASNNQMSLEEFIAFIENNNDSYEDVREQVRKEMSIQRIQRGKVNSNIDITEKEFEAFLANDETLEGLQPEILVRQILVKEKSLADQIVNLIDQGSEFSELAQKYSKSSNASSGGLMNWRKAIDMPRLFEEALKSQPIGFISSPLERGSGYHILKLEDKRGNFVKYEDQWQSRHILLTPSTIRNDEDTINQLNNIRQRIIDGEDFSSLADQFSEDPGSAKLGGDLGWVGLGVFAPEFEKMMLETKMATEKRAP